MTFQYIFINWCAWLSCRLKYSLVLPKVISKSIVKWLLACLCVEMIKFIPEFIYRHTYAIITIGVILVWKILIWSVVPHQLNLFKSPWLELYTIYVATSISMQKTKSMVYLNLSNSFDPPTIEYGNIIFTHTMQVCCSLSAWNHLLQVLAISPPCFHKECIMRRYYYPEYFSKLNENTSP